ncbi:Arginase-2, mitochondrial [Eumeta japonica]|uniref:Arginase-2, mitochondrial n=1 Tax=Eumeta variegata TaxID=151549 RepID=A0A4C1XUJ6_EUMVA|nr:Arginase-2, mitochondrial [Eumeta japonica]
MNQNRWSPSPMEARNPRGVISALSAYSEEIGYLMERIGLMEGKRGEWAAGTLTRQTKRTAETTTSHPLYCESVVLHRSSRHIFVLQQSWPQHGFTPELSFLRKRISMPNLDNHDNGQTLSYKRQDARSTKYLKIDYPGSVDGHYRVNEDMILIWMDAHADINTNKTSGSGSVHGMPVALLVKELADYWPYLPTMDWQIPKFSIKNLGYIGLRSVDRYERLVIEKYNVPCFAMEDIDE